MDILFGFNNLRHGRADPAIHGYRQNAGARSPLGFVNILLGNHPPLVEKLA
jgi:hypothetical protein